MWWLPLLAPIVGGTLDAADPAVVAILRADGRVQCTGTVIAERVVLTAAHCAVQDDPAAARVMFGMQVGAAGATVVDVLDARAHPQWSGTEVADLALVVLARPSPAAPIALAEGAAPPSVRLIGFGDTAAGAMDSGTKRTGSALVTSSTPEALMLQTDTAAPCTGDSGGPALGTGEAVVAVVSRGDAACTMYAKATRVDANRAFIDAYLADTAPHARTLGERCLYDEHCTTGSCLAATDDPAVHYCSRACARDADCGGAMACDERVCRYPVPTPGALGAPCTTDTDCVRGACESVGYCTVRCVSAEADCPAHFTCERAGGIDFFCTPAPEDGGGCCDAGGGGAGSLVLALGVLLLSTGRRCSSRCTGGRADRSSSPPRCCSRGCSGRGRCAGGGSPSRSPARCSDSRCGRAPSPRCSR